MLERTKLGFSSDNEGNFSFGVIHKLRSCLRGEGIKADVYKRGGVKILEKNCNRQSRFDALKLELNFLPTLCPYLDTTSF